MVAIPREVGPGRWRASAGRCFEEFTVGDVYEHRPGRTISEADNTWFTLLTMNQHPLHFDAAYAAKSEFGRPVVNSCLTLSIVAGMSVADVSQGDRQPRLDRHQVDRAGFRRRHGLRRERGPGEARVDLAADPGHRHRAHHRQEGRRLRFHEL